MGMRNAKRGFAYVGLLFLLVILLSLGMAFLLRASAGLAAVSSIHLGTQADYLAEAAANHALWRLLYDPNIPTFAEAEAVDEYQMVNLEGFRYGYNFRPNTATTMALVQALGASETTVVTQSWVVNTQSQPFQGVLMLYGHRNLDPIQHRNFASPNWAGPLDGINVSENTRWIQTASAPNHPRALMASIDDANDINVSTFDGSVWSAPWEFSTSVDKNHLCIGVGYESISGHAMVAGRRVNGTTPHYALWNGTSWTAPAALPLSYGGGDIRHTVLRGNPHSDEMILTCLTSGNDVAAYLWNGSAWVGGQTLTTSVSVSSYRPFDVAYEQQSGHALLLYCTSSNQTHYSTWDGVSVGGGLAFSTGNRGRITRIAPHPVSDVMLAAVVDADNDLHIGRWSGSAWTYNAQIETTIYQSTMLTVALAWESTGQEALVFYSLNGWDNLAYRRWNAVNNTMGARQTGPDFGNNIESIQALTIPGEDRIIVLVGNSSDDLKYILWGGDGFEIAAPVLLDNDIYSTPQQGFNLVSLLMP